MPNLNKKSIKMFELNVFNCLSVIFGHLFSVYVFVIIFISVLVYHYSSKVETIFSKPIKYLNVNVMDFPVSLKHFSWCNKFRYVFWFVTSSAIKHSKNLISSLVLYNIRILYPTHTLLYSICLCTTGKIQFHTRVCLSDKMFYARCKKINFLSYPRSNLLTLKMFSINSNEDSH